MSPLISLRSVTRSFTELPLFDEISLVISERERIGLIGQNGSGKSTLLRIIAGLEHPDSGEIVARRDLRIGYVSQDSKLPAEGSVAEVLTSALLPHQHDGAALVARILGSAEFSDANQPVAQLSGGWKKRLAIARELVKEPELLLLDEPTNHLDIGSIIWLEELIANANFAVLFVSHDRYFIEEVAQRVIELDRRFPKGYLSVAGQYSDFIAVKSEFLSQMQSYKESLANRVRRETEWLRKSARARTTKAKGRITEAERLIAELKGIDLRSTRANFEFSSTGRRTRELIKAERISKALSGKQLFSRLEFVLTPGMRLGVVGNNGSGKTTLLRTLLGELKPDEGQVRQTWGLRCVYFDQARQKLDGELTLKQALCREGDAVVFNGKEIHASSWAKRFLFRSDQFNQPVKKLSGGEQARVLIARLMLEPADILVLDEPTNDLDIPTLEVLEETLCEFAGAIVLVTHDRYMLDRVSTSVLGLWGEGKSGIFADYTQWELQHDLEQNTAAEKSAENKAVVAAQPSSAAKKKLTYAERLELEAIEEKITNAEEQVSALQTRMHAPESALDHVQLTSLCAELAQAQAQVEQLYARWHLLEEKKAAYEKE